MSAVKLFIFTLYGRFKVVVFSIMSVSACRFSLSMICAHLARCPFAVFENGCR